MKKLLLMLVLVLSVLLISCNAETTTTFQDTSSRDLLFEIVDEFGGVSNTPIYENTEWFDKECGFYGESNYVSYDGNTLQVVLKDDNKSVQVYFTLNEQVMNGVYEVDIVYTDYTTQTHYELWYEYQGIVLMSYNSGYKILSISYDELVQELQKLTISDVEWILNELGYEVV